MRTIQAAQLWPGLLSGAAAGAAGTSALNVLGYLDIAVRGRAASATPERTVEALARLFGLTVPGSGDVLANRLAGIGALTGYGAGIIYADYTHSLLGMIALSATLGALAGLLWGRRPGIVIGLVAASHWLLDLIVHRADLPILPGNIGDLPRLGLGLWRYPPVAFSIELALVLIGAWLYWRAAKRAVKIEGRGGLAATTAASLIAVFGVLVLWLDFTGT